MVLLVPLVFVVQVVGTASAATDVAVGRLGNEPHMAVINPLFPENVIIAHVNSLSFSTDLGLTFPNVLNSFIPAGYSLGGDDVIAFDAGTFNPGPGVQPRLHWTYLVQNAQDLSVMVQTLDPFTRQLLGAAIDITPGNNVDDKPWIAADASPQSPFANNAYLVWSRLSSPCDNSCVMFSRSTDGGATWSAPAVVSAPGEGFVWPSHVAVAPNGDLYVAYHTDTCGSPTANMVVIRDSTGGANLAAGLNLPPFVQKTTFPAAVTCNVQDQPGTVAGTDFWMQGANAPYVLPDPVRPGIIYVIANDDPNDDFNTGDQGDVILARSTNNGFTWTRSTIDHSPAQTLQVFPTGAVDQLGNLMAFWYDTRAGATNGGGNFLLDVYATASRDGTQTFTSDFRINDARFDPDLNPPTRFPGPPKTTRIGEYNGAAAANGIAYADWTGNTANGQQIFDDVFSIRSLFPDAREPNDARTPGIVTELGSAETYSLTDLTIHSPTDEDFFRVSALRTGTLTFELSSNSRFSDLDLVVLDRSGNPLESSSPMVDQLSLESFSIAVVQGETYFVRVLPNAGQFPPMNTYSLNIINTEAPTPFGIDLFPASDSGVSDSDDLTNVALPTVRIRLDDRDLIDKGIGFSQGLPPEGYKVRLYNDGIEVGFAGLGSGVYALAFPFGEQLHEGLNSLTARVIMTDGTGASGLGAESEDLVVTLDTTPPPPPVSPDLAASSDSGGVNDDDITSLSVLEFDGTGEGNRRVHLFAELQPLGPDVFIARQFAQPNGAYEILMAPAVDGVYDIRVRQEDAAGNIGGPSIPLRVTVAMNVLNLPGFTASGPAPLGVVVDLQEGTIAGFPGIAGASGKVGIVGIPTINVDANGGQLDVLGTTGDNEFTFSPSGPAAGTLARSESPQILQLSGAGSFFLDPGDGSDAVHIKGTTGADTIQVVADAVSSAQVNGLLPVFIPDGTVEMIGVLAGPGKDAVEVQVFDTISGLFFVDGGTPATNPPNGDVLKVTDLSGKGKIQNFAGGPAENSGHVTVDYAQTTMNVTVIDYQGIEKFQRG